MSPIVEPDRRQRHRPGRVLGHAGGRRADRGQGARTGPGLRRGRPSPSTTGWRRAEALWRTAGRPGVGVIRLLLATGIATLVVLGRHASADRGPHPPPDRPAHPRGRSRGPHRQGRHARPWAGLAIVAGRLAGYIVSDLYDAVFTWRGLITMGAIAGAGLVGFLDDWLKISRRAQPGPQQAGQDHRPAAGCRRLRRRPCSGCPTWQTTISFTRFNDLGWEHRPGWAGPSGQCC